jgi:two-component SAPR family response regulator
MSTDAWLDDPAVRGSVFRARAPAPPPSTSARCLTTVESRFQIRCLGRFEVVRDGVSIKRWRRRAAVTMLKYLVTQRRPIHRDVFLDLLWPRAAHSWA